MRLRCAGFTVLAFALTLSASFAPAPARAQSAAAQPQVQGAPKNDDDAIDDLQKTLEQQQKTFEKINRLNPLSDDYSKGQPLQFAGPNGETAAPGPAGAILKILGNPYVQRYLRVVTNPATGAYARELMKSPNRMLLIYVEIGALIFMLVLRAWRFSKSKHWLARLWTNAWTFVFGWVLIMVVVPSLVLGGGYAKLLGSIYGSLKK